MEKDILRQTIVAANKTYREGHPTMSDADFDILLEQYHSFVTEEVFSEFVDSLHEVSGKIKHPFMMGSLNKLKAEEPDTVISFISKNVKDSLNISAKVDGISCRLHYENGTLVSASTRGDGTFGEDLTDKIAFVKNIKHEITEKSIIDIRGELVILKSDFEKVSERFANPRNATAGIMNRKDWTAEELSLVSFVPYTILGNAYSKKEQFSKLEEIGFKTAWHIDIAKADIDTAIVEKLLNFLKQDFEYEVDGLVLSDSSYVNEDKYRPDSQVAFKANQLIAVTRVIDVEFVGPSKNGQFVPVACLEPVELGGTTVSRATCHNLDYLEANHIQYGSVVKVLKSGDIIPKIIDVIDNSNSLPIELPAECPCCGTLLVKAELNLKCPNKSCKAQILEQLVLFIKKLGCKHASNATLEKLNICSFEDLIAFRPNAKYKTEVSLYNELSDKVFTRSKEELLAATNFNGLSETLINKIVEYYGLDNIEHNSYNGLPNGIGELTLSKFKDDIAENLRIVNMFADDPRYNHVVVSKTLKKSSNGMSICFTGKLNTMSRSEAEKKAVEAGFEVKSVNKKLTYLVTNDTSTGSSKNRKAKELGIQVIDEKEFLKMISAETIENSVDEL